MRQFGWGRGRARVAAGVGLGDDRVEQGGADPAVAQVLADEHVADVAPAPVQAVGARHAVVLAAVNNDRMMVRRNQAQSRT